MATNNLQSNSNTTRSLLSVQLSHTRDDFKNFSKNTLKDIIMKLGQTSDYWLIDAKSADKHWEVVSKEDFVKEIDRLVSLPNGGKDDLVDILFKLDSEIHKKRDASVEKKPPYKRAETTRITNALDDVHFNDYPLVPLDLINMPVFPENKEQFDTWVIKMDAFVKSRRIRDEDVVQLMIPSMSTRGLGFVKRFPKEDPDDFIGYSDFKRFVSDAWYPESNLRKIKAEFFALTQKESYEKYENKFNALLAQNKFTSKEDVYFKFVEGLKPELRTQVRLARVVDGDLERAMHIARTFDEQLNANNEYEKTMKLNAVYNRSTNGKFTPAKTANSGGFERKSFEKNKFNSFNKNKPFNRGRSRSFDASKKTFGSFSKSRSRSWDRKPRVHFNSQQKGSNPFKEKLIKCYKCGKIGHIAKVCRSKPDRVNEVEQANSLGVSRTETVLTTKISSLFNVNGKINSKDVKLTLDSAATRSVIATKIAKRLKIPYVVSDIQVKVADNNVRTVRGVTGPVEIEIEGIKHQLKEGMIVLDHDEHEVLLGLDWFSESLAGLFPAERKLKFPTRTIYFPEGNGDALIHEEQMREDVMVAEVIDEEEDISDELYWMFPEDDKVEPHDRSQLTEEENRLFDERMPKIVKGAFAKDLKDLGKCNVREHVIRVTTDQPIFTPVYRRSVAEDEAINANCRKLLEADIIEPANSEWNSNPFLLKSKDGGDRRMVHQFKPLNSVTELINFPANDQQKIFNDLQGARYISAIDLMKGFLQFLLALFCRPYTAFWTTMGQFQYKRLPFGIKNGPADFSKLMFQILMSLMIQNFVRVYLDDVIIYSNTLEDHFKHIQAVVKCLRNAGLKLNKAKCKWCCRSIKILGHIIGQGKIMMDPAKIEAIKLRQAPRNVKQVQEFLGICNYYRKFIEGFAKLAKPITDLLKKDNKFIWSEECQAAFEGLKEALISYPILRLPDFKRLFILFTDASGYALGAILAQRDDEGREYVVSYASRALKNAELHYGITEKECLGVVWAVKHFRIYLEGTKFDIVTDHIALVWLINMKDPRAKFLRWSIFLGQFDYTIIHKRGLLHSNADTISRPVCSVLAVVTRLMKKAQEHLGFAGLDDVSSKTLDPFEDEALLTRLQTGKYPSGISKKQMKRVESLSRLYIWDNDELFYLGNGKKLKVPRPEERERLAQIAHESGHYQVRSTFNRLSQDYYWKNMMKAVEKAVNKCLQCREHHPVIPMEHPAIAIKVTQVFDEICIDLTFGLPVSEDGYKGLFNVIERVTKYLWSFPIKSKEATEIAEKLWLFMSLCGPPKRILSDQGKEFCNEIVNTMLEGLGVKHITTSAYHPRTNGLVERVNRIVIESLSKYTTENQLQWPKFVPLVVLNYNTKKQATTNYTPFFLMYGRECNGFNDYTKSKYDQEVVNETQELENRVKQLKELEVEQVKAIKNIEKSQEQQKINQNNAHRITEDLVPIGTKVYVSVMGLHDKLYPKYRGPFTVVGHTNKGNYWVENILHEKMKDAFPLSRLKLVVDGDEEDKKLEGNFFRVQKIIGHRLNDKNEYEYLTKWKDFPERYNSWEPAENFAEKDMLSDYWKSTKEKQSERKQKKSILKVNSLLTLAIVLLLFGAVFADSSRPATESKILTDCVHPLKDDFYYCGKVDIFNTPIVAIDNGCKEIPQKVQVGPKPIIPVGKEMTGVHILSKNVHEIYGGAYECSKEIVQVVTYKNVFWARSKDKKATKVKLTRQECKLMVDTKKCNDRPMECIGKTCSYDGTPKDEYSYLSEKTMEGPRCSIIYKQVIAKYFNDTIFEGKNDKKCTVYDLFCETTDSIIIWEKDLYEHCPFSFMATSAVTANADNLLYDSVNGRAFRVVSKVNICNNMEAYTTQEGLILTQSLEAQKLAQSEVDITGLHELMLSEQDANNFAMHRSLFSLKKRICDQMANYLRILALKADTFDLYKDFKGNERVFYAHYGNVYVPTCVKVGEVCAFLHGNDLADVAIPVKFTEVHNSMNSTNISEIYHGYIYETRIIRREAPEEFETDRHKRNRPTSVYLPKTRSVITRTADNTLILSGAATVSVDEIESEVGNNINFPHYSKLLSSADIIGQIQESQKVSWRNERISDTLDTAQSKEGNVIPRGIQSMIGDGWTSLKMIIFYLVLFVIIVLILFLTIIIVIKCKCRGRRTRREFVAEARAIYSGKDECCTLDPYSESVVRDVLQKSKQDR